MEKLLFFTRGLFFTSRSQSQILRQRCRVRRVDESRGERDERYGHTEIIVERWRRPIRFDWRISQRGTKRTVKSPGTGEVSGEGGAVKQNGKFLDQALRTSVQKAILGFPRGFVHPSRFPDNVDSTRLRRFNRRLVKRGSWRKSYGCG